MFIIYRKTTILSKYMKPHYERTKHLTHEHKSKIQVAALRSSLASYILNVCQFRGALS